MTLESDVLIKKWFFYPALIWLVITLLTGIWIRLEWNQPMQSYFRVSNLIHSHSHAALLGWAYIWLAGFTLKRYIRAATVQRAAVPMAVILHLSNIGMLIAFAYQGYAFWSILFSSVHLFATVWLAVLLLLRRHQNPEELGKSFEWAASAWLWLILSGFGPFALAFSGGMAGSWAQFWLGSYLYLLVNGWITFILIAVLVDFSERLEVPVNQKWSGFGFNLMFYSLPVSMLSMFNVIGIAEQWLWLGWAANICFAAGTIILAVVLFPRNTHQPGVQVLIWSGLIFLVLKSAAQIIAFFPPEIELSNHHLLKVAFLHLMLVGAFSLIIIAVGFRSELRVPVTGISLSLVIWFGAASMMFLLFFWPLSIMAGFIIILPYQLLPAVSGAIMLTGVLGLAVKAKQRFYSRP